MLRYVFATTDEPILFLIRVAVGLVILAHGAQKLLGWFGGYGFKGTMQYFTGTAGLPWTLAFLVIVIESFGALGLVTGLFARPAALGIIAVMIGAIVMVHWPVGFFMNWFGAQPGEGFEFHLLVIAMAAAVLIWGAGAWSLDGLIARGL